MQPPEERSPSSADADPQLSEEEQEFERSLAEVERSLLALKDRYAQVQRDRQRQKELQHRFEEIRQTPRRQRTAQMQAEVKQIQQQLEILAVSLESSLLSWRSFQEPFWQAVRFAGIGIIIGWLLKSF